MIKSFKTFISEIFNRPVTWRRLISDANFKKYVFNVNGHLYQVEIGRSNHSLSIAGYPPQWSIEFGYVEPSGHSAFGRVNVGNDSAISVFSTVIDIARSFISEESPEAISFLADKEDASRTALYRKIIQREFSNSYTITESTYTGRDAYTKFLLRKK